MLFNSLEYALFLLVVTVASFLCPGRWRVGLLLLASYVFYAWWRWEYLFLLAGQTLVCYLCGWAVGRTDHGPQRKGYLALGIVVSLGLLGTFKYAGFISDTLNSVVHGFGGGRPLPQLEILLPIGISFYTFQGLGYCIDVYRKRVSSETYLPRFALYMAFFPQLTAGPIERASRLLEQFKQRHAFELERLAEGGKLFVWGLFKKAVIADRLALYVDRVYATPDMYSGATLLLATYFFAFQIYCDFSGYSDMAIGSARILGYDLMMNFRLPYLATSMAEFWRRWHISLSSWFRDYVYISLGGSRVSTRRWITNIAVVFLLSGLWHGASWSFVLWGSLLGGIYLLEAGLRPIWRRGVAALRVPTSLLRAIQSVGIFHLVAVTWIFFRANTVSDAFTILRRIMGSFSGPVYLGDSMFRTLLSGFLILVLLTIQGLQAKGTLSLAFSRSRISTPLRLLGYVGMLAGIALLGIFGDEFIYFKF